MKYRVLIEGGYMHSLNALLEKSRAADKGSVYRKKSPSIGDVTRAMSVAAWIIQLLKSIRENRHGRSERVQEVRGREQLCP